MHDETLSDTEISEQLALRRQRFEQVVGDMRTLLRHDLEQFAVRETKRVFLAEAEVASALSLEAVKALRLGAQAVGRQSAEAALLALADLALWEAGAALTADERGRELSAVEPVWRHIRAVEAAIAGYLEGHGFRPSPPVAYRPPAFFVAGLYMPGLVEHYWRIIAEIRELGLQRTALAERTAREKLQAVWDASERG
jgi:hypothetical protein